MISARPRILVKVTFLKHFALEVWVSICLHFLPNIHSVSLQHTSCNHVFSSNVKDVVDPNQMDSVCFQKYVGHPISSDNGLISLKLLLKSEFYYPWYVAMDVAYSCLKYGIFIMA